MIATAISSGTGQPCRSTLEVTKTVAVTLQQQHHQQDAGEEGGRVARDLDQQGALLGVVVRQQLGPGRVSRMMALTHAEVTKANMMASPANAS